jgi:hypothetical protein
MISKVTGGFIAGVIVGTARAKYQPQNQSSSPNDSYGTWLAVGIIMAGLDVLWMLIFWSLAFFVYLGFVWFAVATLICVAGCHEVATARKQVP